RAGPFAALPDPDCPELEQRLRGEKLVHGAAAPHSVRMKFGELIPLIGALLNLSLAVFVLFQNPRSTVSRAYFLLGTSFAIWNYGTFWLFRIPDGDAHYGEALFWARFLQFVGSVIPPVLCHVS